MNIVTDVRICVLDGTREMKLQGKADTCCPNNITDDGSNNCTAIDFELKEKCGEDRDLLGNQQVAESQKGALAARKT